MEHARQMIAQAIEMHIELMQQVGEAVPSPSSTFEFTVDAQTDEELCTWVEVDEARTPAA